MKKFIINSAICYLFLMFTAMTCVEDFGGAYVASVTIENCSNDTIELLDNYTIKLTAEDFLESKSEGYTCVLLPGDFIMSGINDYEGSFLYIALAKQGEIKNLSDEEIIEKNLIKIYQYSYTGLKMHGYKVTYTGEYHKDSINRHNIN